MKIRDRNAILGSSDYIFMIIDQQINSLLTRRVAEVVVASELSQKLKAGKKLRIKLGADPTRPDLHLGHSVVLSKLKEFQALGHTIIFLIGDYTGLIGDPSGKSKTRPQLSAAEIKKNAKTYLDQVGKILDTTKAEVRFNSEWYKDMSFAEVLKLTARFTVARILERDDFAKRYKSGNDIGLHELLYPVMQAYDSVALHADVELGGTDQKFNLLAARELQKKMGQVPQDIMTMQILVGLDGKGKMSKSLDNYIGISEAANEQFGKIMSLPDEQIIPYFELATEVPATEIGSMRKELARGRNPRDLKVRLGREIVTLYHGAAAAEKAAAEFTRVFSKKEKPAEMPEVAIAPGEWTILEVLSQAKLISSKAAGRRLIEQGGVRVNDKIIKDWQLKIDVRPGIIIQAGKRKFIKVA